MRSAARRALLRLEPSDENIESLRQDMIEYPAQVSSVYSTLLLKEVGASLEVHITNLRHPNDLVRHHAQQALFEHFGLQDLVENFFSRLRMLVGLNLIQLPSPLIEGAEGLESVVRALAEGASPESLDLGYTPGTYGHTLPGILDILNASKPWPPVPIEAMKELDGQDAEWLREQLFSRLNDERSTRTLEALIEIKPRDWRTILEEEQKMETERCAQGSDNDDSDWLLELRAAIAELD
jgi:HEAT repeat protein